MVSSQLIVNRYLVKFRLLHDQNDQSWVPLAHKLLEMDPLDTSSQSLEHLAQYYQAQTDDRETGLIKLLDLIVTRLDYDHGTVWHWQTLAETLSNLRRLDASADSHMWQDRHTWWPRFHFTYPHGSWQDPLHVTWLSICASFIIPSTFKSTRLYQTLTLITDLTPECYRILFRHGLNISRQ